MCALLVTRDIRLTKFPFITNKHAVNYYTHALICTLQSAVGIYSRLLVIFCAYRALYMHISSKIARESEYVRARTNTT